VRRSSVRFIVRQTSPFYEASINGPRGL